MSISLGVWTCFKESCVVESVSSVKKNYSFVFGFEVLAIRGK